MLYLFGFYNALFYNITMIKYLNNFKKGEW